MLYINLSVWQQLYIYVQTLYTSSFNICTHIFPSVTRSNYVCLLEMVVTSQNLSFHVKSTFICLSSMELFAIEGVAFNQSFRLLTFDAVVLTCV